MSEPHKGRTRGESTSTSCSFQRRESVTGRSPFIICSAVKSEWVKQRTTVSVSKGRILAVKVPQLESKKRSEKLASWYRTSRNCVASSGETAFSLAAQAGSPKSLFEKVMRQPVGVASSES